MVVARSPVNDRFRMVGQTFEQRFRVDRVVAEGGFGVVYAGQHLNLEVPIAIKVLKFPDDMGEKARNSFFEAFQQEAKAMARLKHANIVQVLDTGVSAMSTGERASWMVLEWLEGETLAAFMHRQRRAFSPAEILGLLGPVFDALAFAHEQGVAHRDIKPGNIMLVPGRRGPVAKVLDFGIAKVMTEGESAGSGDTHTVGSFQAYSPRYAAPEQLSRARTGPWTDVHALGLIVTEMLIGQPPYRAQDSTELFGEVLSPQRPTPAKFNIDLGPWEPVLARAVAFRQDQRFANAAEFLAALEATMPAGWAPAPGAVPPGTLPPGMMRATTSQPGHTGPQLNWNSQPAYLSNTGSHSVPGAVVPGGMQPNAHTGPGAWSQSHPVGHTGPGGWSQSQPMAAAHTGNTLAGGVAVTGAPAAQKSGVPRGLIIGLSSVVAIGGIVALGLVMFGHPRHTAGSTVAATSPVMAPPVAAPQPPAAPATPPAAVAAPAPAPTGTAPADPTVAAQPTPAAPAPAGNTAPPAQDSNHASSTSSGASGSSSRHGSGRNDSHGGRHGGGHGGASSPGLW